jgi:1-acyl-sn-glycerol-3-phosphate acyltransferase
VLAVTQGWVRAAQVVCPRAPGSRAPRCPTIENFTHYVLDAGAAETLQFAARCVVHRDPCLLEGLRTGLSRGGNRSALTDPIEVIDRQSPIELLDVPAAATRSLGALASASVSISRALASYLAVGHDDPSALLVASARTVTRWSHLQIGVDGTDAIEAAGRKLLVVANHASHLDPVAIISALGRCLPGPLRVVAKAELFSIPGFSKLATVKVDRSDALRAARQVSDAIESVRAGGGSLLVFPEGTRSPNGELRPFKSGAFRAAAAEGGLKVLPIAIAGTFEALPPGRLLIRRAHLHVSVGSAFDAIANHRELKRRTHAEVAHLLVQARTRLASARP